MTELPDIKKIKADIENITNELCLEKSVSLSILRLDNLHPKIPGNKFFKLYYFLRRALDEQKNIITYGGAFSNHLAATAYACNALGINCTGIVRGDEIKKLSHTLLYCTQQGMRLEFISRENYDRKSGEEHKTAMHNKFGDHVLIPEGGFSEEGVAGAALIADLYKAGNFSHICCAAGTATTAAGLMSASDTHQQVIAFSALKKLPDFEERIQYLIGKAVCNYALVDDHHFGGYAKSTEELIFFMNSFYQEFFIPLDFVYTAKMMFGVYELIRKDQFPAGSNIICIHTGGLQGNLSLPPGTLNF